MNYSGIYTTFPFWSVKYTADPLPPKKTTCYLIMLPFIYTCRIKKVYIFIIMGENTQHIVDIQNAKITQKRKMLKIPLSTQTAVKKIAQSGYRWAFSMLIYIKLRF